MLAGLRQNNRKAIRCPKCSKEAGWHDPFVWLIREQRQQAEQQGLKGLERSTGLVIALFPDVFGWEDSDNPFRSGSLGWGRRSGNHWGVLYCPHCSTSRKHCLDWPKDAFYQVTVRGKTFIARDRTRFVQMRRVHKNPDIAKAFSRLLASS